MSAFRFLNWLRKESGQTLDIAAIDRLDTGKVPVYEGRSIHESTFTGYEWINMTRNADGSYSVSKIKDATEGRSKIILEASVAPVTAARLLVKEDRKYRQEFFTRLLCNALGGETYKAYLPNRTFEKVRQQVLNSPS